MIWNSCNYYVSLYDSKTTNIHVRQKTRCNMSFDFNINGQSISFTSNQFDRFYK